MKFSPCKECEDFPCQKHLKCKKRIAYVDSFKNTDLIQAIDIDTAYKFLPM